MVVEYRELVSRQGERAPRRPLHPMTVSGCRGVSSPEPFRESMSPISYERRVVACWPNRERSLALLIVGGTADHASPFDWSSRPAYDSVSSPRKAEVALDCAEHFVFTGACQSVRRLLTVVATGFCKRGSWCPFAPSGAQRRDSSLELEISAALENDLRAKKDLSRWFPVYDAPGL